VFTVGPNDLDALSLYDWTVLTSYAKHVNYAPVVMSALLDDPVAVDPEDLADELDHLLDTRPPKNVRLIIVGTLKGLAASGVAIAAKPNARTRRRRRSPKGPGASVER
jgi:hypothetical protein